MVEEIRQLEEKRAAALVAGDRAALAALLADDLVHVHANGKVDNKDRFLDALGSRLAFVRIDREPMTIRVEGDLAIATGALEQEVRAVALDKVMAIRAVVTTIWRRSAAAWQLCLFQATRID